MALYIKLCTNFKGEYTHIIVNDKYELRKDGKVYLTNYFNKEILEYPDYIKNREIKQLCKILWKS